MIATSLATPRDPTTWSAWRAFLAALFGLPLSDAERAVYRQCTGRPSDPGTDAFSEAWLICGRRAGKSFVLALIAVYLACFRSYREFLGPGEVATIAVIAADRRQARVIMRYTRGLLAIPLLAKLVEREATESIDLRGNVTIEVGTASHKTTRGYSFAAVLADELAFWPSEDSATPDYEILDAVRPGMGTIPGSILLCASSPYARRGALFDAHRRYHGKDGSPVLVWQAATRTMNATFPQRIIDAASERDPAVAGAEYLAQFRTDVEAFVRREAVESCVALGILERPAVTEFTYFGFVDPSGGSADSMTMAVAHREGEMVHLDAIREVKPPFSPQGVVAEFSTLFKSYRIGTIRGDRYGGEWPREAFKRHGIDYLCSDKTKSELFVDTLPLINSRRVNLLDNNRMIGQFVGLERKTGRSGRDSIDHSPASHDDLCNAVAGAIVSAATVGGQYLPMCAPFVASIPRNFPSSGGDVHNPAIGRGIYSGGESAMERFARGREA
jgi:Terminase large subunit, T4likevirus-type, N-terminal